MIAANALPAKWETKLVNLEIIDRMPKDLRREICFAARVWQASDVLALYNQAKPQMGHNAAVQWIASSIRHGDEQDLMHLSWNYKKRYGVPLPHVAADATCLEYRPSLGISSQRRVRGMSGRARRAWDSSERLMPVYAKEVA